MADAPDMTWQTEPTYEEFLQITQRVREKKRAADEAARRIQEEQRREAEEYAASVLGKHFPERWGSGYYLESGYSIHDCDTCGAFVLDEGREKHANWHEKGSD